MELADFEARALVSAYWRTRPTTHLARCGAEAIGFARSIGGPVALKAYSPQMSHRRDLGAVALNLEGDDAVRLAFSRLTAHLGRISPETPITGCLVQAMAPADSVEAVVSMRRDEQFGPLLMFGLGGIHTEILHDVSHHLTPLSRDEAFGMIRSIRSYLLLKGVGGHPAANLRALEDVLLALAAMAQDFPQVFEAELNPVLVNHEGALVAEARFTFRT